VARPRVRRHATSEKDLFHSTLRADKHALRHILEYLIEGKPAVEHHSCAPQHTYNARMKTTHTLPPTPGADDALFDQLERRLQALTTAPLHAPTGVERRCVDEFADGFLGHIGLAPIPLARRWRIAP
jgi:hypothetical protein